MTWNELYVKLQVILALVVVVLFDIVWKEPNIAVFVLEAIVTVFIVHVAFVTIKATYHYYFFDEYDEVLNYVKHIYTTGGLDYLLNCAYDTEKSLHFYVYYTLVVALAILLSNWIIVFSIVLIVSCLYAIKWQISWLLELIEMDVNFEEMV